MRARKRAATAALGVLALVWILVVGVPAVAGVYPADELALSGVDVSRAPVVSVLVHVPDEVELDPGTVRMQEDGKDVGGLQLLTKTSTNIHNPAHVERGFRLPAVAERTGGFTTGGVVLIPR